MNKLSFIAYAIILVFIGCGGDTDSTGGSTGSSSGSKTSDSNTINTSDSNTVNTNKNENSSNVTKDKAGGDTNTPTTGSKDKPTVSKDKSTVSKDKSSDTTANQPSKGETTYKGGYSVKKIVFSDGSEQSFSYNEAGKITNITGGHEFVSTDTYVYDTRGQLIKKGNRDYTYNGKGQLLTITTPGGVITFSYNAVRDLIKKVVGSFSTTYSYNDKRQRIESNDGGLITTYTYDDSGKLKSARYSDNGLETTYSYGDKGEILTSVTSGSTTTYSYDYKSCTTDFKVLFLDLPYQLTSAMCRK